MNITVLSSSELVDTALDSAAQVKQLKGLNTLPSDTMGKLEAIWVHVHDGLQSAYLARKEDVEEIFRGVAAHVKSALAAAGVKAQELQKLLLERLSRYMHALIDGMLSQVRAEFTVEGSRLRLSAIEISQSITLSGSVELSLQRAFELTSNGELSVNASYAIVTK